MYLKSISIKNFRKFYKQSTIELMNQSEFLTPSTEVNISRSTSLIIGKNNSGKTTISEALKKVIVDKSFIPTDFNLKYIGKLVSEYFKNPNMDEFEIPYLEFVLNIGVTNIEKAQLHNILPFTSVEFFEEGEENKYIELRIKWEVKEQTIFKKEIQKFVEIANTEKYDESIKNRQFLKLLTKSTYKLTVYNQENKPVDSDINKIIDVTMISANKIDGTEALSKAYKDIMKYQHENLGTEEREQAEYQIEKDILGLNNTATDSLLKIPSTTINEVLKESLFGGEYGANLRYNLTRDNLMGSQVMYEYLEGDIYVPENQFGLGYTNLIVIISEIIKYLEKYSEESFLSKINILIIEEPETYMHPQMQQYFIKTINDTLAGIIGKKNVEIKSQLIITTHSTHILNSKLHQGNSFDNINYITTRNNETECISITDNHVNPGNEADFTFLKKHLKVETMDMFFADAIIFVEGITEYQMLQYWLSQNNALKKYGVSIILINGAHALVYKNLIETLGIPTAIITDLDIQRTEKEKNMYSQMTRENILYGSNIKKKSKVRRYNDEKSPKNRSLLNINRVAQRRVRRITTNNTIKKMYHREKIGNIVLNNYASQKNIAVFTQKDVIKGVYATSFEEALFLENANSIFLKEILKKLKPQICKNIMNKDWILKNSYKLQVKMSNLKTGLSNEILYELYSQDKNETTLLVPKYIKNALMHLELQLQEQGGR